MVILQPGGWEFQLGSSYSGELTGVGIKQLPFIDCEFDRVPTLALIVVRQLGITPLRGRSADFKFIPIGIVCE